MLFRVFFEGRMFSQKYGALTSCESERDAGTGFQHAGAHTSEGLEDMDAAERTYGYIDALAPAGISWTAPAESQPGDSGSALMIGPTSTSGKNTYVMSILYMTNYVITSVPG